MTERAKAFVVKHWVPLGMLALGCGVGLNAYAVESIDHRDAVTAAEQKLSAAEFEQFLRIYVEQGDYLCEVDTARSAALGGPTPPAGLCTIKAP